MSLINMQPEIEAKFLYVNHDELRAKLKSLGAELEYETRLMQRVLFDFPDNRFQSRQQGRLRIRGEGDKVFINFKHRDNNKYTNEIETTVGSYEKMEELLITIGLHTYSNQESKRELWSYKNTEVCLDQWPWIDDYIEIEGPDEETIKTVAKDLGFDWEEARFGSVDTIYAEQYKGMKENESIGDLEEVKFDMPLPQWLKERL